jgi:hypothetical protein
MTPTAKPPALAYTDSAGLMQDIEFQGRVKVACLTFANNILGEDPATAAHNTRLKWAQQCMLNPQQAAQQCQHNVVMQPQVQAVGKDVTDADLQIATETALAQML